MQPHVNLGINYRKHFERSSMNFGKILRAYGRTRRKLYTLLVKRRISYGDFKEKMKDLKLKKKMRIPIIESHY